MKNYGDLGGCYPPRPTASTDNILPDLHNSSQDTQPHSLIVKWSPRLRLGDYSPILITSPEATNCFSIITLIIIRENKIFDQFPTTKH